MPEIKRWSRPDLDDLLQEIDETLQLLQRVAGHEKPQSVQRMHRAGQAIQEWMHLSPAGRERSHDEVREQLRSAIDDVRERHDLDELSTRKLRELLARARYDERFDEHQQANRARNREWIDALRQGHARGELKVTAFPQQRKLLVTGLSGVIPEPPEWVSRQADVSPARIKFSRAVWDELGEDISLLEEISETYNQAQQAANATRRTESTTHD